MHKLTLTTALTLLMTGTALADNACPKSDDYTLAIHGGAGVIVKAKMDDTTEAAYRKTLMEALSIGDHMLKNGYPALDVVEAVVVHLEDDPKFNAGKGAVFSAAGENELDAAIMDGRDRNAGTIAGVKTIKNPIRLARAVMDKSRHVMLQSEGAESFAVENGLETVDPAYFHTERRWNQLQKKLRQKEGYLRLHESPETKFGTVGAVVKDTCGNLAAGTSTGGLTAKKWGRVGDTPIIGAGTYADNDYCAVSATGTGEYFIRATIARDICARRQFLDEDIQTASDSLIQGTLENMRGTGGIVAIDNEGTPAFSFNTEGMYRGYVKGGNYYVGIFGEDE